MKSRERLAEAEALPIAAEITLSPEKCQVSLEVLWIGNASSKLENQINKAITSCFLFCESPSGFQYKSYATVW